MTKCLHQLFRCNDGISVEIREGYGDCSKCTCNPEENKKCKGYVPVGFVAVEVVEKSDDNICKGKE